MLRDAVAIVALVASVPFLRMTTPADPVYGLGIMLWGQVAAGAITWIASLIVTARISKVPVIRFLTDMLPYFAQTAVIIPLMNIAATPFDNPWLKIPVMSFVGAGLYIGGNRFFKSRIQQEVFMYFRKGKID